MPIQDPRDVFIHRRLDASSQAVDRAKALIEVEKWERALTELQQALVIDPNDVEVHYLAGWCYLKLGQHAKARESAKQDIGLFPDFAPGFALLALDDLPASLPTKHTVDYCRRPLVPHADIARHREAEPEACAGHSSRDDRVYNVLSVYLGRRPAVPACRTKRMDSMNEELLETLLAALQLSPDNHLLRRQVVQGLLKTERWEEIREIAEPLLRGPQRAFALYALSRVAAYHNEIDHAREYYEEAVKLDHALADEDFEAELEPQAPIRLPYEYSAVPESGVLPYAGPRVTFADVGGMSALKEQIRLNILYPFQHPEVYAAYGKKIGGGLLMFGPPGCGKTHIARATAGELGASFYTVELNEVLSMWVGQSEKQLGEIFETARANAPAVIFIDEIDALGAKRSELHSSPMRFTITQLLTEMDGIAANNQELLVLGATNEPWNVDAAFRRPGRFDRVLFVSPPDAPARAEILRLHARGRKIDPKLPWEQIADKTELYSGADLASLVDRACESALSEALSSGNIRPVVMPDFQKALRDMRPSTTDWLRRAKNYVTYANQDGLYSSLAQYLEATKIR